MPLDRAKTLQDTMTQWRHQLHANPEIAFQEFDTAKFVADQLKSFGIEVQLGLATTGVVGVLSKGEGDCIALRADMDALEITEQNTFAHASKNPGKMHACGHDGHTAMLLGAAKILAESGTFRGTVVFIFQPAEEIEGGAEVMVREGLFEKFPIQEIYGLHNWPSMPAGQMAVGPGAMMAACDTFDIVVKGRGGHAAMPHLVVDPILASAHIVTAVQSLVSRWVSPHDSCVVSITKIQGGDTYNVIPDEVVLKGTARWFSPELGCEIEQALRKIIEGVGKSMGCDIQLIYDARYPPTINTPIEAQVSADVMASLVGETNVNRNPIPSMGAEDFAFMLGKRPGCYGWLGAGQSEDCPKLHNPHYDFNDDLLSLGAAYWVALSEHRLI
ncbi:MAG: peptidase M20 [Rhodospirillaceae bacterium]|nr:MAG: peptidase M20 [Rhodospirillaceae bacterium]